MSDGSHEGKGHGRGGFASPNVGQDGLTGGERARLAGRKGAIMHSIKVYGHRKEEYEALWQETESLAKSAY